MTRDERDTRLKAASIEIDNYVNAAIAQVSGVIGPLGGVKADVRIRAAQAYATLAAGLAQMEFPDA
tara:strand:+ start:1931 stop:2128 length:198 start_codon:yes stop_codon:yes gene_type:complete